MTAFTVPLLLLILTCHQTIALLSPEEQQFVSIPSSQSARDALEFITSVPHVAGLPEDFLLANYVASSFAAAGIPDVSEFDIDVLLKSGWRPKHTIYLLSWSGEEYGLLGSTGWAELNFPEIKAASAYLNVDTVVSGETLTVSATPALATVWEGVMADVGPSIAFANGPHGEVLDANVNAPLYADDAISTLGSGSDYTVFLDHFGIASLDFEFSGPAGTYGVYHSTYDSFDWIDSYGGVEGVKGSSFDLMAGAAKVWGVLALRLADSDVIPFDHEKQAAALKKYSAAVAGNGLDLSALDANILAYEAAAAAVALEVQNASHADLADLNTRLSMTERQFLSDAGLPKRPWMKHTLQAPGFYLGYAAEALPGVQQALDDGDVELAQEQVGVVANCVQRAATFLAGN